MPVDLLADAGPKDLLAPNFAPTSSSTVNTALNVLGFMKENRDRNAALFANGWGTGVPKAAYDLGGKVTDLTGSPVAGYAANVLTNAAPALLSNYTLEGAPVVSAASGPAKKLMQSALKPTVATRLSGESDKAIQTMLQEGISPTRAGMDKANQLISNLNSQVDSAVNASPATVSLDEVGQRLLPTYQRALVQANPQADLNAVRNTWQKFLDSPLIKPYVPSQFADFVAKNQGQYMGQGVSAAQALQNMARDFAVQNPQAIPVQLAHAIKKGTYASLGGKTYGEIGSAQTEAMKAIAAGLREGVLNAVPEAAAPLKREADLMNVLKVAGDRAILESNKNPLGLAALRIDNPLAMASFMADRSAALKAILARGLYTAGTPQLASQAALTGNLASGALYQR